MRRCRGRFVRTLVALLALAAAVLSAGCSADPPEPRWEEVISGRFTGAETERLDLGTLYLAGQVRVAWDLSGPSDARAEFELKVESRSTSARSWKEEFAPQSDTALGLTVAPDYYRVTVSQLLRPRDAVGYSGTFRLHTEDLD